MTKAAIWEVLLVTLLVTSTAAQPLPSTCPSTPTPQCNSHGASILYSSHDQEHPPSISSGPVESAEQQQAIIAHLRALQAATAAADTAALPSDHWQNDAANSSSSSAQAWAVGDAEDLAISSSSSMWQQQELPLVLDTANTSTMSGLADAPSAPSAGATRRSQVERQLTFLGNRNIKVGVDMQRAGVISWISSPHIPGAWKSKNLINTWDQGRLLQQSFYGCNDGSCWHKRPWLYNPVQGGSWTNAPSMTTHQQVEYGRMYVEGHPRNWGGGNLIQEVTLSSDIRIKHNYIKAKFTVKYTGSVTHPYMTQEVPAVFVDRRFSVLAYYAGKSPWTGDPNVTYTFPGAHNIYATPTERWAAILHSETGWGIGVYNAKAWLGITAYRVGPDRSAQPWDCSYFAHTIRMQLHPGMQPYTYTAYITVGTLSSIRATFAKIAKAEQAQDLEVAGSDAFDSSTSANGALQGEVGRLAEGAVTIEDGGRAAGDAAAGVGGGDTPAEGTTSDVRVGWGAAAAAAPGPAAGQPDLGRNVVALFGRHARYRDLVRDKQQ